jgi:hypothetical protein
VDPLAGPLGGDLLAGSPERFVVRSGDNCDFEESDLSGGFFGFRQTVAIGGTLRERWMGKLVSLLGDTTGLLFEVVFPVAGADLALVELYEAYRGSPYLTRPGTRIGRGRVGNSRPRRPRVEVAHMRSIVIRQGWYNDMLLC